MRKILLLSICIISALVIGCEKSETPNKPGGNNNTLLRVSTSELIVYADTTVDQFVLSKSGYEKIAFNIIDKPAWIEFDHSSGIIEFLPDTIMVIVNTSGLEQKTYNGTIKITSDGGDLEIQVTLNNAAPRFEVWLPLLTMSRDNSQTTLELYNKGGQTIIWNVTSMPSWILLAQQSGVVYTSPYLLGVSVDMAQLQYGMHEGEIIFQSNAGQAVVSVVMTFERQIEVYPGSGAAKLQIGQTYGTMRQTHGEAETNEVLYLPDKLAQVVARYPSRGMIFKFEPSSVILQDVNANHLYCIHLFQPYDGLTENNLGMGSQYSDVIAAYGEPQETITDKKAIVYESGIAFHFDEGMTTVTGMSVFSERAALTFE